jgi:hypothetical protein
MLLIVRYSRTKVVSKQSRLFPPARHLMCSYQHRLSRLAHHLTMRLLLY